jgi:hypothetical protein
MKTEEEKLVMAEAETMIDAPIEKVYRWVVYEPLEKQLTGTRKLPGVVRAETINGIELGKAGHRRLVRLADGNTAVEEHTHIDEPDGGAAKKYFAYRVWNYTLKAARSIEYARGEWRFSAAGRGTRVEWRYSFKLDEGKSLGRLGSIGRAIFDLFFLKGSYREFMAVTLEKLKADLER